MLGAELLEKRRGWHHHEWGPQTACVANSIIGLLGLKLLVVFGSRGVLLLRSLQLLDDLVDGDLSDLCVLVFLFLDIL